MEKMGGVVSSTADVIAIVGSATTLILGIFGAVRYSRCRVVACCWGACRLTNAPPADAPSVLAERAVSV
jgi:hypothetical protein